MAGLVLAYVPLPYAATVLRVGSNPPPAMDAAAANEVPWYAVMTEGAAPRFAAIKAQRASNAAFIPSFRSLKMALTHALGEPSAVKNAVSTVSYSLLKTIMSAMPDIMEMTTIAGSDAAMLEVQGKAPGKEGW